MVAGFKRRMHRGGLERPHHDRAAETLLIGEVPLSPAFGILVESNETRRQFPRQDHLVVVGRESFEIPGSDYVAESRFAAVEVGALAREGDVAPSLAETEED